MDQSSLPLSDPSTGSPDQKPSFWRKISGRAKKINLRLRQHQKKIDLDKKLVIGVAKKNKLPSWQQFKFVKKVLSPQERMAVFSFLSVIVFCLIAIGLISYFLGLKIKPAYGGAYSEALVGVPRYINPILSATNDVDRDLTQLIFSGLLRRDENQDLVTDLAEKYSVSEDQKEYTFVIKKDVKWHDGAPLTVDDIIFTIDRIKDPAFESPLRSSFQGVTAEKLDDSTIKFVLKEPYAPFLGNLTFGIIPKHLWENIGSESAKLAELNLKPIGSGPFKFDFLRKDRLGTIKSIALTRNNNYYGFMPYIEGITFKFYADIDSAVQALVNKNDQGLSFLPQSLYSSVCKSDKNCGSWTVHSLKMPQYSAIFFNQNRSAVLKDKEVRRALYAAIDRERIVSQVLNGEGEVVNGPILPGFIGYDQNAAAVQFSPETATKILDDAGWKGITPNNLIALNREQEKKDATAAKVEFVDRSDADRLAELGGQEYFRQKGGQILSFELTAVDSSESRAVAEAVQKDWQAIGVRVSLNFISGADIKREAIKTRNYDALLYSEIIGADPDPYPFWHSSQMTDPGLTLAIFTDRRLDKLIETGRSTNDVTKRAAAYKDFQSLIVSEIPAIFLFSPTYTYVVADSIHGIDLDRIIVPSDRLNDIARRFIKVRRGF